MTDAVLTQAALEQWAMPNAAARSTQVVMEVWADTQPGTRIALLTAIGLEQWVVNVPVLPPPVMEPNMQALVSVNTG